MPSDKPKCPNCGPVSFKDICYAESVENEGNTGGGTVNTSSANATIRRCKTCKAVIEF